jgi:hypothetical protein
MTYFKVVCEDDKDYWPISPMIESSDTAIGIAKDLCTTKGKGFRVIKIEQVCRVHPKEVPIMNVVPEVDME